MAVYGIPIDLSSVKYAQRTVPGVADAGVLHGGEDSPVTAAPGSPRCLGGPEKVSNDYLCHPQQHLFSKLCCKVNPWACRCSGSPPWSGQVENRSFLELKAGIPEKTQRHDVQYEKLKGLHVQ